MATSVTGQDVATQPSVEDALERHAAPRGRLRTSAPMVAFLGSDAASGVSGQVFAVRNNEIFLMSQPRPLRVLHRGEGWTPEEIAAMLPAALGPSLVPLERSADVFSWDPV